MGESHEEAANHRCVHCLRATEFATADHVFPRSWYPDNTPMSVQRWTVPSCLECNRELGRLERDLLIRLVLCIDPKSEGVAGLTERVLRALGVDIDLLPEERAHRDNLRARIRAELVPAASVAEIPEAMIPGLGPHESGEWSIPVPWASMSIITEKIIRGCEYRLTGCYIERPYGIRTFVSDSGAIPEPYFSLSRVFDLGPGCEVRRLPAFEDPRVVLYWISVWGILHLGGRIDLEDELRELDKRSRKVEGITPEKNAKAMRVSPYLRGSSPDSVG